MAGETTPGHRRATGEKTPERPRAPTGETAHALPRADGCPSTDELAAFASGAAGAARERILAHLDRCADCRRIVATAAADDDEAQPDASPSVKTGPRVGRFVLRRILGEGAMGVVHLAYDPELKRNVALKVIKPDSGDALARERLFLEAQTAAQLTHPNTVTIFDVGLHEGQPYVAMEFVEGTTVAQHLKNGASWRDALTVMLAAGEGLAAAHRSGLVHRDFKPANVLLGNDGTVKVSDFGLACFADDRRASIEEQERALEVRTANPDLSESGYIVGTPGFISPELLAGAVASPASDQFAYGVALYQALYGERPFRGPTLEAIYEAIERAAPPPPRRDSRVPLALWPIVERMLDKDPARRFATMADALLALREAAGLDVAVVDRERSPFPGLVSFSENDASLFFGRGSELNDVLGRLRDHAIAAIVGPSGAGKSSFIRALVIPSIRREEPGCEVMVMRPGAQPMLALARLVGPLVSDGSSTAVDQIALSLRTDRRRLASILSDHARHHDSKVLLYVDQFEELYTQCTDRAERIAFAEALAALGSEPGRPLRLTLSLRSDFLDRAAECEALTQRISAGFLFLGPPGRTALAQAIIGPLTAVGYDLEDPAVADEIAGALENQPGALPLLQFIGGRLWDERDREKRLVTRASLQSIGQLSGALAAHGDRVFAQLSPADGLLARAVFTRLVTPERTRHALQVRDLEPLATSADVRRVVDALVRGRLLVADAGTVELVHEALIYAWPTLKRWLDDDAGDATLLADLGASARRWDAAGRPEGMLWTGVPARLAIELVKRTNATALEGDFVAATSRLARRATRRRRALLVGAFTLVGGIAIVASVAYFEVRASQQAEQRATKTAGVASQDRDHARAVAAEAQAKKERALAEAEDARRKSDEARAELTRANAELRRATADLDARRAELAASEGEMNALRQKVQEAKALEDSAARKEQEAQERLNTTQAELAKAKKELAEIEKRKQELLRDTPNVRKQ